MIKHPRNLLALILLLSVLLRIAVALYYGDIVDAPPLLTDQRSYSMLGARLIEGKGFTFERRWYPFTPADTPTAHWSFLYSLFIAAVYAVFGVHPLAARLVQAILGGLLLPWMVYCLTKTLFGEWRPTPTPPLPPSPPPLPLLAAASAAVYGYFILYAATMMTETFYIIALLWSLEVGLRVGEKLRQGAPVPLTLSLQLGASLGVAALIRQAILPWVPVFFLWLAWQGVGTFKRWNVGTLGRSNVGTFKRFNSLILAGLVLLAFILPWTVRNYRVYGEFLLLNSNTGYAMYSAQHPIHGTRFQEFAAAPLPAGLSGNEAQMDRELMRQGIRFVLDDPGRYLLLSLSRVRAFFEFWPTPDTTLLHNIGRVGSFGLFLPFMVYGLYLSWKTGKRKEKKGIRHERGVSPSLPLPFTFSSSLLYLFIAVYTLLHVLTWAMVRYRLPVDAVALPFAALALYDLYERARKGVETLKR